MSSSGPPYRPRLKDVASLAGVDASLVSKLLSGSPTLKITTETRKRVLEAVEVLGYTPNVNAQGFRLSRTWTIGVVFPDLGNPVYMPFMYGARARAAERGYGLVLAYSNGADDSQAGLERLLQDGRVDGLLIASGVVSDEHVREMASGRGPVVVADRLVKGVSSSILVDDAAGCRLAAQHLCDLGHTRLLVVSGPRNSRGDTDSSLRRVTAFTEYARAHGARVNARYAESWDAAGGFSATSAALQGARPTAIFAGTVMLGLGVLRAAHSAGKRIPDDLSIVALHDATMAAYFEPPLTTIGLPMEELGRTAVDRLIGKIEGATVGETIIETPPVLILRSSTTKARA